MPQEHGQLYVYEHRCVCCTTKFTTIDQKQLTCSPQCFLIWEDTDQYIERRFTADEEKPTFLELFFG